MEGAIGREYSAHLAALEKQRCAADPPDKDDAIMEFTLAAAPILSRAGHETGPGQQQLLYEEMARLTGNTEALRRIEEARARKLEYNQATHRHRNKRKTRERCMQWSNEDSRCPDCDVALIFMSREAQTVCPNCGKTSFLIDNSFSALPFGERPMVSESSYSKQSHMSDLLDQVQGIERTEVPEAVVQALTKQLSKHRCLSHPEKLTPNTIKHHLKLLKLSMWYDNAMQLCLIVSGGKCPRLRLPPDLIQDIHTSFAAAQQPFEHAIKNSNRTNFLAYSESPQSPVERDILQAAPTPASICLLIACAWDLSSNNIFSLESLPCFVCMHVDCKK